MHTYTVIYSKLYNVWTVGYYDSSRVWVPLLDCATQAEADRKCDDYNAGLVDE